MNELVRKVLIVGVPVLLAASCGVGVLRVVAGQETNPRRRARAHRGRHNRGSDAYPDTHVGPTPEEEPAFSATASAHRGRIVATFGDGGLGENYAPEVKRRIDRLGEREDCDGLQEEFNNADRNDAAQRNRTGDGNADLMSYIEGWLRHAGCY